MTQSNEPIALLSLEERLYADLDGRCRRELDAALSVFEEEARGAARLMAPPEEHARLRKLVDGIGAARAVLRSCCPPGAANRTFG